MTSDRSPHAPLRLAALAASLLLAFAATTSAEEPAPTSKSAFEAAIRDYIMAHPEVIRESLAKADQAEQVERTKQVLRDEKKALYAANSPSIGPADAKITIVEFMDYNCPYCRKTHPLLRSYLDRHPDTRPVIKDIANFGKDSEAAGRIALAAARQGKFTEMHEALLARKGTSTEAAALEIAGTLGLDLNRLKADAASKDVDHILMQARDLANVLNVGGTPLFIIGHNGIAGAPDDIARLLEKYVDEVRTSGCDVC